MPYTSPYHTDTPEYPKEQREVYHDKSNCPDGERIKKSTAKKEQETSGTAKSVPKSPDQQSRRFFPPPLWDEGRCRTIMRRLNKKR